MSTVVLGVKTDLGVYAEVAAGLPGPAGWTYRDPVFGAEIMRLTDERDGPLCGTFYSYWGTGNCDCTRLLTNCGTGQGLVIDFDPVNFKALTRHTMPAIPGAGSPVAEGSSWSQTDPETLYTHVGAQLHAYNARTRTYSLVADLSGQLPGEYVMQMSKDGADNRFAWTRRRSSDYAFLGFVVYDRAQNKIISKVDMADIDETTIDKSGRYLLAKLGNQGAGVTESVVVNLESGSREPLIDDRDGAPGHGDAGADCYVGYDNNTNRMNWRRLSDPHNVRTLLALPDWTQAVHTSMLADDEGWALVGLFGEAGASPAPLRKELIQVATDGSQRVRRLLHHRSVYHCYEDSPRGNISRDGRFVFFTSNMGGARADLYVAKITPAGASPARPEPSPTTTPTTPTTPASSPAPTPAQAQYEYVSKTWPSSASARLTLLNQMGADGYLLSQVVSTTAYFSRPKR
jgi:hypothetical protein